ncbi:MAG: ABC transporter permease [Anaerolineae bacterium]|nr:ABC transporter permease [Anaerolineae bacterium]
MSLRRLLAIVRKEVLHIVRDARNLFLVTISPAFLLLLLSYVFTFEVSQVKIAAYDLDRSAASRHYLASLGASEEVQIVAQVQDYDQIDPLLVTGQIDAGLVIPPHFADTIHGGKPAHVQAIVDGGDPFAASQAITSLSARSAVFVAGSSSQLPPGRGDTAGSGTAINVLSQAWYNAGLESLPSMVPALLGVVLVMPTMAFALALSREKETGTLEGLVATPVLGSEYLLGKLIAYLGTGLISSLIALLVALLWFRVPFRGSIGVYLLLVADFLLACMGATVLINNFVRSQQSAMFIVLVIFIVPTFFLAGLINPVSTSSLVPMLTSYVLPSTHFVEISRVVFLKGLGLSYLARPALILFGMGSIALVAGLLAFRKKVV